MLASLYCIFFPERKKLELTTLNKQRKKTKFLNPLIHRHRHHSLFVCLFFRSLSRSNKIKGNFSYIRVHLRTSENKMKRRKGKINPSTYGPMNVWRNVKNVIIIKSKEKKINGKIFFRYKKILGIPFFSGQ